MWQSAGTRRRVALLDEGWAQTIELAMALKDRDHDIIVITANGRSQLFRQHGIDWQCGPELGSPALAPWLEERITAGAFDHVLPLTERWAYTLWDLAPAWADRVYPATAPWQRALLRDKLTMSEHVAAHGVAIPWQRRLAAEADLELDLAALPVVVKAARGAGGTQVHIVETAADLARARAAVARGGDWGVQELIPGPTFLVGGVFQRGRAIRQYAAEKVEQYPTRTGPAIRLRSASDPRLLALAARVIGALDWTGFASVDFVRAADGDYRFLEVNPRPWGSLSAARLAGVDLFTPFAELLAGGSPAADLAFADGHDCRIFPRYLLAPAYRGLGGALHAVRDWLGPAGRDWRSPSFVRYALSALRAPS
ncbi:MAG TPA: ATP-grasp domain-containing protein [Kofleriaceae bacterium]